MIKGLISLFTSGAIFSPMILLGSVGGFFSVFRLTPQQIRTILTDYHNYVIFAGVALCYVFCFRKIYKDGGESLDYVAMILKTIAEIIKCLMAYVLSMSFVILLGF